MPTTTKIPIFRSFYAKLAGVLVVLLACVGLLYNVLGFSFARHHLEEVNQRLNRDLAQNLVADRNLVEEGRINALALRDTFHDYMVINPSIEIYLLDLDGTILSFSADPEGVKRTKVRLKPIHTFLNEQWSYPLLGDDPRNPNRKKAFSVTPVPSADNPEGYLYVVLRGERFDMMNKFIIEQRYLLRLTGSALAVSLLVSLVVGLVTFHLLTRRLRRLSGLMGRFRVTGFASHEPYARNLRAETADEVDHLGLTFDAMAERITAQFEELKHQDTVRREMVAQVSHDLRTPLASLHGYLEVLQLKDEDLSSQQRAEYLSLVHRQSERLTRLVAQLFELAKLDATESTPQSEPFVASELAQDVAQKFQLQAKSRGMEVSVTTDDDLPLVYGDIALIERVLENLIDNALDHTSKGGSIRIPLHLSNGEVTIAVSDTGKGIAKDELPKIFDRFYQVDNKHRGSGHAGLGLAIAKRIVELHGAELRVSSQLGEGTQFAFSLPVWNPLPGRGTQTA